MAESMFGFTPTNQVKVSTSPFAVNQAPDMRLANSFKALESLVTTGAKVYAKKAEQDQEDVERTELIKSNDWYKENYSAYQKAKADAGDDVDKLSVLAENFDKSVLEYRSNLTETNQQRFQSTHNSIMSFESRDLSGAIERDNISKLNDEVATLMPTYFAQDTEGRKQMLQESYSAGEKKGISKRDVGGMFVTNMSNYLATSVNADTLTYGTYNTLKSTFENLMEIDPKLKGSKEAVAGFSRLNTLKNGLDSQIIGNINGTITTKNTEKFTTFLQTALDNEAITQDEAGVYKDKMAKSLLDPSSMAKGIADKLIKSTNGKVNLSEIENVPNVDDKTFKAIKTNVKEKIFEALGGLDGKIDMEAIKYHSVNNTQEFKTIFSDVYLDAVNQFAMSYNVEMTPDQRATIQNNVERLSNLAGILPDAVNEDTRIKTRMYLAIANSPAIENKGDAFKRLTDVKKVELVSTGDKSFSNLVKGLDFDQKAKAREFYSTLKFITNDKELAIRETKDLFNPVEFKGIDLSATTTAFDRLGLSVEHGEALFQVLTDDTIFADKDKDGVTQAEHFRKLFDNNKDIKLGYENGMFLFRAKNGTTRLLPLNAKQQEIFVQNVKAKTAELNMSTGIGRIFEESMEKGMNYIFDATQMATSIIKPTTDQLVNGIRGSYKDFVKPMINSNRVISDFPNLMKDINDFIDTNLFGNTKKETTKTKK